MNQFCTILPPHVVDSVAKNGSEDARRAAIDTEAVNRSLVAMRYAVAAADRPLAAASAGLQRSVDDAYDRDSIDDEGLSLLATVHFGRRYDNAFWNGSQMVFGDGDGELFNRFTIAVDIIGHELGHGITGDEAGLIYLNQSGALNESLSDVWGSLVKQHILGQTAEAADWLIGAGLFTSAVQGVALRSMKEPGTAY